MTSHSRHRTGGAGPARRQFLPLVALLAFTGSWAIPNAHAGTNDLQFKPTGVAQYDAVTFDSNRHSFDDDARFRSARLGFSLKYADKWQFKVEHELTDRSSDDLYLKASLPRGQSLTVGQFKQPSMLEQATSARQTALMERSLLGAFDIGRRMGVAYGRDGKAYSIDAAVFGKAMDGSDEGLGATLRATRVMYRDDEGLLHIGAGGSIERPHDEYARISSRPESRLADRSLIDTGLLAGASQVSRMGVEALWIHGAWSLQGELAGIGVDIRDGQDFRGHGGYAMASWSPSGDRRSYKAGTVGAPALDGSAWELFLRHSQLDLDDGGVHGGHQADWALGAVWHLNSHLRLMANYIVVDSRRGGLDDEPRLLQARAQFAF